MNEDLNSLLGKKTVSAKALMCMGNLSYKTYLFISYNFPGLKSQLVVKGQFGGTKYFIMLILFF